MPVVLMSFNVAIHYCIISLSWTKYSVYTDEGIPEVLLECLWAEQFVCNTVSLAV